MHTADSDIAMYTVIHNTNLLENLFDWNLCCDVHCTVHCMQSQIGGEMHSGRVWLCDIFYNCTSRSQAPFVIPDP